MRLMQIGLAINLLLTLVCVVTLLAGGWRPGLVGPTVLFALFAYFCWRRLRDLQRGPV